jgi:hypothetical protein
MHAGKSQAPQAKAASNAVPLVTRQLSIQQNFDPYDYYEMGKGLKALGDQEAAILVFEPVP